MITLVIGGARSGKSAAAERLVADLAGGGTVTYVATGMVDGDDADFAARVAAHRDRRPPGWETVECGADLAAAIDGIEGVVLVDSLGTWVGARWFTGPGRSAPSSDDVDVDRRTGELVAALRRRSAAGHATVLVTEEVGLGVHPESTSGREFRDLLGRVNVDVAAVADDVLLVVAGRIFRPVDR